MPIMMDEVEYTDEMDERVDALAKAFLNVPSADSIHDEVILAICKASALMAKMSEFTFGAEPESVLQYMLDNIEYAYETYDVVVTKEALN